MDRYPKVLLQQAAPLVKLEISQEIENTEIARHLTTHINQFDISGKTWDNSIIKNRLSNMKYIVKVINESDQVSNLPSYKAKADEEHSILSPFNVQSDLFPNGILSTAWFTKYVEELPFAFLKTLVLPDSPEQDFMLIRTINTAKQYYHSHNVKFVVILVSKEKEGENKESKEEEIEKISKRVSSIREQTNLPRLTGLLHLHSTPETLERDSDLVITTLLSNIKNSATEFYANIENKIKLRNKKYYSCPSTDDIDTAIEITPKALETRNLVKQGLINQFCNPYNLEQSLKLLELAYQNLIEIMYDNFGEKLQSIEQLEISAHDAKIYLQYRQLADIIAFHIVRGYFSLEDPVVALKKHKTHIANVLNIVWTEGNKQVAAYNNNWISVQYEWLAQLMQFLPASIISKLNLTEPKQTKTSKMYSYHGGIRIQGPYSYDLITSPSLVYKKAVDHLKKSASVGKEIPMLSYLYVNETERTNHIVQLLEAVARCIGDSNLKESYEPVQLKSIFLYINWLIGEEYYAMDNVEKAVVFYEASLANGGKWGSEFIARKLVQCYSKLGDGVNELYSTLKLCKIGSPVGIDHNEKLLDHLDTTTTLDENVTNLGSVLSVQALIYAGSETYIFDECQVQLVLKNLFDVKVLQQRLPAESSVNFYVEELEIQINRLDGRDSSKRLVSIEHDPNANSDILVSISLEASGNHYRGTADMSIGTKGAAKVVDFVQRFHKPGMYEIRSVKSRIGIEISSKNNTYKLTKHEEILYDNQRLVSANENVFYSSIPGTKPSSIRALARRRFKTSTANARLVRISPLKPNLTFDIDEVKDIVLGEKVSIPVKIQYTPPRSSNLRYSKLSVVPSARIRYETDADLDLVTQICWDDLKDDHELDLRGLVHDKKSTHHLNVTLHSPPNGRFHDNIRASVEINLRMMVSEEKEEEDEEDEEGADEEAVYDVETYVIPVLKTAFASSSTVSPRYQDGHMPSPFLVSDTGVMPSPIRLWLAEVDITAKSETIDILGTEIAIKSKNPELTVESVGSAEGGAQKVSQLLATKSKSGFSHRSAGVVIAATIKWKRQGSSAVNEYRFEEWEMTLPMSDPRVLVDLRTENDVAIITYIIENPTSRIFMFATQLDDVEDWTFTDARNIVPLKQPAFPVLPFSRHVMEFYGNYEPSVTTLPVLKVFDVQFKVGLPPLSTSPDLEYKDRKIYWNRKN